MSAPTRVPTRLAEGRLTSGPAARYAGVHRDTLKRWARQGYVPAVVTPSGQYLFDPADLDDLLRPAAEDA
jgi:excisionase family DNA binding protein